MGFRDNERIGISDLSSFARWIRAVCKGHYRVEFDPKAKTAYVTADKRMVFPRLNDKVTVRDMIRMRGFGIHETSHPIYQPDVWDVMKANPVPQGHPLGAIYNMCLDVHAESMRAQEWAGDAKALSEFGAVTGRDVTERLGKDITDAGGIDPESDFFKVAQVMLATIDAESEWNVGLRIGFDELQNKIMPIEVQQGRDAIEAKFNLKEVLLKDTNNASTLWELTKDIYRFLWPDKDPEEEVNKCKGEKKGADGDPSDKEGEGEGDGDPAPINTDKIVDGEPSKDSKPAKKKIPVEKLVWSKHYEDKGGPPSGQGFDYANFHQSDVYIPIDFDKFKVIDYEKGQEADGASFF
jgi:hypothetical protein